MSLEMKIAVFLAASAGMAWLSRASLRSFESHGLYRFLTWEAILILALLNIDVWFLEVLSWHQIVSWLLLVASLLLLIHGIQLLRRVGRPGEVRNDPSLLAWEKTTELVRVGAYRYIRHPLYSSLLFLAWGVFFKRPSWLGIGLALLATLLLTMAARTEESENIAYFGSAYEDYMNETRMFVPFLF